MPCGEPHSSGRAQGTVPSPFSCSLLNGRCVFVKSTVLEKAVLMAYVDVFGFQKL